jgi:hypothetical protein
MIKSINILGLLAVLILTGCEKDENKIPPGTYLTKVIYQQGGGQIGHYYYNNQGFLSSREYESGDKIEEKFIYKYENGKVNRIDYYGQNSYNDYTLYQKGYMIFDLDMANIIKSTRYPELITNVYEYENDRAKKTIHSANSYTEYQYDNSGNIEKAILFNEGNIYWIYGYKYDSKRNPFYNVEPIYNSFSELNLIGFKCPNNLIYEVCVNENNDTLSESEYIYEYNSFDLPTMSYELYTSETYGYDRDSTNTLLYEYEIK